MQNSSHVIRLFISSTFSDFKHERDALHNVVFPRLKEYCSENGIRFQPIDLRWGVNEGSVLDQRAMGICLEEIGRCQRVSSKPNFLVLLGDRYGWQPVPDIIPEDEFKLILRRVTDSADSGALIKLEQWYRCDYNAVPAFYVLQPRTNTYAEASDAWYKEETYLRNLLRDAVKSIDLSQKSLSKFEYSATAQEVHLGALNPLLEDVDKHVFGFYRHIQCISSNLDKENAANFVDMYDGIRDKDATIRLEYLKSRLRERIPNNITEYNVDWNVSDITLFHLHDFCQDVYSRLKTVIKAEIDNVEDAPPLVRETEAHQDFADERTQYFTGRNVEVDNVAEILRDSEKRNRLVVITGASGSGKSSFMAEVANITKSNQPEAVIVQRFVGVTPASSNTAELLHSIMLEVAHNYQMFTIPDITAYEDQLKVFSECINYANSDKPLLILIDAIDQLNGSFEIGLASFLSLELPPYVHLVVTATEDIGHLNIRELIPNSYFMSLSPMKESEGLSLLNSWLNNIGRKLTSDQQEIVMNAFAKNGLPLYLKLAYEQVRHWRSYDNANDISTDIHGLVSELLGRLKKIHGAVLVDRVFDYLAVSRSGLTEDELLDVLSQDKDVMNEFNTGSFHDHVVDYLPVVIWSRLLADLYSYLTERDINNVHVLTFSHRYFIDFALEDCLTLEEVPILAGRLSMYYLSQSNYLDSDRKHVNVRKIHELPYNLRRSKQWIILQDVLTNFDFCMAKCNLNEPEDLVRDFQFASKSIPKSSDLFHQYSFFIREISHILHRGNRCWSADKIFLQLALEHADTSLITRAAEKWLSKDNCGWSYLYNLNRPASQNEGVLLSKYDLSNYNPVECFIYNEDKIILVDNNGLVSILNLSTGNAIEQLGPGKYATDRALISDNILITASDKGCVVWDLSTRLLLSDIVIDSDARDYDVHLMTDGRLLVITTYGEIRSGHRVSILSIWNYTSGEKLHVVRLPESDVDTVYESFDGNSIFISTYNELLLWNTDSRTIDSLDNKYHHKICKINDKTIVSCTYSAIYVWDLFNKRLINKTCFEGVKISGFKKVSNDIVLIYDNRCLDDGNKLIIYSIDDNSALDEFDVAGFIIREIFMVSGTQVILSSGDDGDVLLWDYRTGMTISDLSEDLGIISSVTVINDGKCIIQDDSSNYMFILHPSTSNVSCVYKKHSESITFTQLIVDNHLVTYSEFDNILSVFDLNVEENLQYRVGHESSIEGLVLLPDGNVFSRAYFDSVLYIWDPSTGRVIHTLDCLNPNITGLVIYKEHLVTSTSDGFSSQLILWSIITGEQIKNIKVDGHDICELVFFTDDKFISKDDYSYTTYHIWDAYTLECLKTINIEDVEEKEFIYWILPINNQYLAIRTNKDRVFIWDYQSECILHDLSDCINKDDDLIEDNELMGFLVSDDHYLITWTMDTMINIYDPVSGELIYSLDDHDEFVSSVYRLPNNMLLSCYLDNTCKIWSLYDGELLYTLTGHNDDIENIIITKDNQILSWDSNVVILWDVESGKAISKINKENLSRVCPEWLVYVYRNKYITNDNYIVDIKSKSIDLINIRNDFKMQSSWHAKSNIERHLVVNNIVVAGLTTGELCFLNTHIDATSPYKI